ncbi:MULTISPECIES: hypothetical protein [Bacillaceae]|uniref:PDGLE domain-containing protein n=1 Tax=Evansella alkalicola TaxID=745819 RepID=A0ABS6JPX9_9BACI|nr:MULTISPECIES: hypothetical protein [Bacillaceae]MBU9720621.1 hypothetical protein [Bacillus alkalicola]
MKQLLRLITVAMLVLTLLVVINVGNASASLSKEELANPLVNMTELSYSYNQLESNDDADAGNIEAYNYEANMIQDNGRHIGAVMTLLITAIAAVFAYSIYRRKKQME